MRVRISAKRLAVLLALGVAMGMLALAQKSDGAASTVTLAEMREQFRPLLIFSPTGSDARLLAQVRAVSEHAKEAADRQLVTVAVIADGSIPAGRRLAATDAAEARRRFHVGVGEFAVVLVGKDGGEKLRGAVPIAFERLRDAIDAMPMRREEMQRKAH